MFVQAHGVRTHIIVEGEGDPVLLVHGWGGSAQSLTALASLIRKTGGRQTILIDLPGFGQSESPPPEWGTEDYAQTILAVCDALKHPRVSYFGHSFGGALGIYLAANHPKRMKKLTLCNSSFKRTKKKSRFLVLKNLIQPLSSIAPQATKSVRLALYRVFFPHSDISRYPHLEEVFKHIIDFDLTPLVEMIKTPTLILWGEDDHITPLVWGQELHDTIVGSTLVVIPGERHGLPLRAPETIAGTINSFLSR